jgi:hypothetical protein
MELLKKKQLLVISNECEKSNIYREKKDSSTYGVRNDEIKKTIKLNLNKFIKNMPSDSFDRSFALRPIR